MAAIEELLTSKNEVALQISFGEIQVEVTQGAVVIRDPSQPNDSEQSILAVFLRDQFDDIIAACEVIPAR